MVKKRGKNKRHRGKKARSLISRSSWGARTQTTWGRKRTRKIQEIEGTRKKVGTLTRKNLSRLGPAGSTLLKRRRKHSVVLDLDKSTVVSRSIRSGVKSQIWSDIFGRKIRKPPPPTFAERNDPFKLNRIRAELDKISVKSSPSDYDAVGGGTIHDTDSEVQPSDDEVSLFPARRTAEERQEEEKDKNRVPRAKSPTGSAIITHLGNKNRVVLKTPTNSTTNTATPGDKKTVVPRSPPGSTPTITLARSKDKNMMAAPRSPTGSTATTLVLSKNKNIMAAPRSPTGSTATTLVLGKSEKNIVVPNKSATGRKKKDRSGAEKCTTVPEEEEEEEEEVPRGTAAGPLAPSASPHTQAGEGTQDRRVKENNEPMDAPPVGFVPMPRSSTTCPISVDQEDVKTEPVDEEGRSIKHERRSSSTMPTIIGALSRASSNKGVNQKPEGNAVVMIISSGEEEDGDDGHHHVVSNPIVSRKKRVINPYATELPTVTPSASLTQASSTKDIEAAKQRHNARAAALVREMCADTDSNVSAGRGMNAFFTKWRQAKQEEERERQVVNQLEEDANANHHDQGERGEEEEDDDDDGECLGHIYREHSERIHNERERLLRKKKDAVERKQRRERERQARIDRGEDPEEEEEEEEPEEDEEEEEEEEDSVDDEDENGKKKKILPPAVDPDALDPELLKIPQQKPQQLLAVPVSPKNCTARKNKFTSAIPIPEGSKLEALLSSIPEQPETELDSLIFEDCRRMMWLERTRERQQRLAAREKKREKRKKRKEKRERRARKAAEAAKKMKEEGPDEEESEATRVKIESGVKLESDDESLINQIRGKRIDVKVKDEDGNPQKKRKIDLGARAKKYVDNSKTILIHKCSVPSCRKAGTQYCEADTFGPVGYRCLYHRPRPLCYVEGCKKKGVVWMAFEGVEKKKMVCDLHGKKCTARGCSKIGRNTRPEDELGPKGYRCAVHGGARICVVEGCSRSANYRVLEEDKFGPRGPRCAPHNNASVEYCTVPGCDRRSEIEVLEKDKFGVPGKRCGRHGKMCTVPSCTKLGRRLHEADDRGPAGYRCDTHGKMKPCSVAGCPTVGRLQITEADELGPAGWRCTLHGKICVVEGCTRCGKMVMPEDEFGKKGLRCVVHGGRRDCNVEGCKRNANLVRKEADHLGPPGHRCPLHALFCSVEGCKAKGRVNVKVADSLGPRGWRCFEHKQGEPLPPKEED